MGLTCYSGSSTELKIKLFLSQVADLPSFNKARLLFGSIAMRPQDGLAAS